MVNLLLRMYMLLYVHVRMVCCVLVSNSQWVCSCMASHQGSNPIRLRHGHRFRSCVRVYVSACVCACVCAFVRMCACVCLFVFACV